ncbi:hypothetical protein [Microbacterium elymi]|uniref:DUF5671 domain-containing protein n=1 Tax=Microbacterium elymi TaxID=2909587 RepID=A0ABY5NK83_9MICO|nr:hypothetical protein [Microbacterium elymi]UUT35569.1 hypothetical protein L2X98_19800 [Microbacterium elymi]
MTPLAALIVLVLVPITVSAGESLETLVGRSPAVARHEELGRMLLPWAIGLFAVALVQWLWFGFGRRRVRTSLSRAAFGVDAAVAVSAVAVSAGTMVLLVLIGDAGARAVWGGLVGT